jgi:hypothetical protein
MPDEDTQAVLAAWVQVLVSGTKIPAIRRLLEVLVTHKPPAPHASPFAADASLTQLL